MQNPRCALWFGTRERAEWFPTPLSGADVSPDGWSADGTLLNGGGFALNSFGSHKTYSFEWKGTSARETAQKMQSFASGSYGRGLIYFQDPLTYKTNVLPAQWADPSLAEGYEGVSLVYGVEPIIEPQGRDRRNFPTRAATYVMNNTIEGFRGKDEALFIPIPEGHLLAVGAAYESTGTGGVYLGNALSSSSGISGNPILVEDITDGTRTGVGTTSDLLVNTFIAPSSSSPGAYLWIGKSELGPASVTLKALIARIVTPEEAAHFSDPSAPLWSRGEWVGGQGNSGCRFLGRPTYINNTGVDGGQISFAATFKEVGSWNVG